jgi:hypothetical protein
MAIGNSTDRFNGVVASLAIKVRCVVAAESNVASLSGITNPYSGVNIADLDRILLVAQTDPIENGVWNVAADGPWTRAFDWDGNRDVEKGSTVWAGQSGGLDKLWQVQTDGVILPGSTAQTITILFDPTASAVGQPNPIVLPEIAGAGPDVPGEGQVWVRDDVPNVLIFTDDLGTDHDLLNTPLANPIVLAEIAAAGADVLGFGQIWVRDDNPNVLVFTNDLGTDTVLGSGGGGGIADGTVSSATLRWSGSAWVESTNVQIASNGHLRIIDTTAVLRLDSTSSSAGEKRTEIRMISGAGFVIQAISDSGSNGPFLMGCSRTGTAWDTMQIQTDLAIFAGSFTMEGGSIYLDQVAAALAADADHGQLWVRDDNPQSLMFTDDDDTDFVLNGGGGGGLQGFGTWRHRTETATPPASGQIRFDNADPSLATNMFVSETNANSTDMSNFLALLDDGAIIYLQDKSNADNFFVIEISSNTDSGTYRTFGIQNIELEGSEPGQNQDMILVGVQAAGGGGAEVNDLSSVVTWANVPDANITVGSVTQHVASIDHDSLLNFLAAEHVDWAGAGAGTIHTDNYIENATHTGQVTGAGALALDVTAVTAQPASGALIGADTIIVNDGGVLSEATLDQVATFVGGGSGSTFVMVTPVVISFGGDDTWETISNAALASAGATHALIKCFCQIAPTAGAFATQIIHLRETGSAISKATSNRATIAGEEDTSAVGITTDTNDAWVKLDGNQDFDILQDQTGVGSQIHQAWIIGYMA